MQLVSTSINILDQLTSMLDSLKEDEYCAELELLSGNTIGKHLRHVVEFFDLLMRTYDGEVISYDDRKHDRAIEESRDIAKNKIEEVASFLKLNKPDRPVRLRAGYTTADNDDVELNSSFYRELAYNIEHAIHHMAIMKIAIQTVFPKVHLEENFGIAYSTIRYQKQN